MKMKKLKKSKFKSPKATALHKQVAGKTYASIIGEIAKKKGKLP